MSLVLSAGEWVDEQVVRVVGEEEVSSAWRDVWELEASELDPEKNEGVTFLWKRVKFMEGNPRSVLDFWAGVEGVDLEWIMTSTERSRRGRGKAPSTCRSLYITLATSPCVIMTVQVTTDTKRPTRFSNSSSRRSSQAPAKL